MGTDKMLTCLVCFYDVGSYVKFGCGHSVCIECYQKYVKLLREIACPACRQVLDQKSLKLLSKKFQEVRDLLENSPQPKMQEIYDEKFNELAIQMCWQKCPSCHATVERIDGCKSMHCRCGKYFCYGCGKLMKLVPIDEDTQYCECFNAY